MKSKAHLLIVLLLMAVLLSGLGWLLSLPGDQEGSAGVAPAALEPTGEGRGGEPETEPVAEAALATRDGMGIAPEALEVEELQSSGDRTERARRTRRSATRLVGRVVDPDGQPVDGAEAWFSTDERYRGAGVPLGMGAGGPMGGPGVAHCTSEGGGNLRVSTGERGARREGAAVVRLSAGAELVGLIRHPGFAPLRIDGVTVSDVWPHDLGDLRLEPAATVAGVVVTAGGRPVEGARLALQQSVARGSVVWRADGYGLDVGETDAEGRFRLDEVRPGPFELLVDTPFAPTSTSRGMAVLGAAGQELRIVIKEGGSVAGHVVGVPPDRKVQVVAHQLAAECGVEGGLRPRYADVDPRDGSFRVHGLVPKGPVRLGAVEAEATDSRQVGAPVREIAGVESAAGLESAVLEWKARAVCRGRVVVSGPEGEPVPLTSFTVSVGTAPAPDMPFPARPLQEGGVVKRHHPGGRFEFDVAERLGTQETQMNFRIRAPGYAEWTRMGVAAGKGQAVDLGDVVLTPAEAIRVHVVDAEDQRPLHGAGVYLASAKSTKDRLRTIVANGEPVWGSTHIAYAETGEEGWGEVVPHGSVGAYWLMARADGYLDSEPMQVLRSPETLKVELTRGATVEVLVRSPGSDPISGISVRLLSSRRLNMESLDLLPGGGQIAVTTRAGKARFGGVASGTYVAQAMAPDTRRPFRTYYESAIAWPETTVQVVGSAAVEARLVLEPPVAFEGQVVVGGQGLAEARVTLNVRDGRGIALPAEGPSVLRAVTDAWGRFRFEGVPEYSYMAHVEHASRATAEPLPLRVKASMGPVTFELPVNRVRGKVVDKETGEPVEGGTVSLLAGRLRQPEIESWTSQWEGAGGSSVTVESQRPAETITDVFGEFEFEGIVRRRAHSLLVYSVEVRPLERKLKSFSDILSEQEVRIEVERIEEQEEK